MTDDTKLPPLPRYDVTIRGEYAAFSEDAVIAWGAQCFAAGQAAIASSAPAAGWKLVPTEATPAMIEAAGLYEPTGSVRGAWRDMLAAAPTAPAAEACRWNEPGVQTIHALLCTSKLAPYELACAIKDALAATAQAAPAAEAIKVPGLGSIWNYGDGYLTLQFVTEEAAHVFMQRHEPTVDVELEAIATRHAAPEAQPSAKPSECPVGCKTECIAMTHGCPSECPARPWQPASTPAPVKAEGLTDNQIDNATQHIYHNGRPVSRDYRVGIVRAAIAAAKRAEGGEG